QSLAAAMGLPTTSTHTAANAEDGNPFDQCEKNFEQIVTDVEKLFDPLFSSAFLSHAGFGHVRSVLNWGGSMAAPTIVAPPANQSAVAPSVADSKASAKSTAHNAAAPSKSEKKKRVADES